MGKHTRRCGVVKRRCGARRAETRARRKTNEERGALGVASSPRAGPRVPSRAAPTPRGERERERRARDLSLQPPSGARGVGPRVQVSTSTPLSPAAARAPSGSAGARTARGGARPTSLLCCLLTVHTHETCVSFRSIIFRHKSRNEQRLTKGIPPTSRMRTLTTQRSPRRVRTREVRQKKQGGAHRRRHGEQPTHKRAHRRRGCRTAVCGTSSGSCSPSAPAPPPSSRPRRGGEVHMSLRKRTMED